MAFEIEVKKNAFSRVTFYIDQNCIRFDGNEILIKNIDGFGYMSTQTSVNGINTGKTFEINIWQNNHPKATVLRFMGAFGGGEANDKFSSVIDQLWTYFGNDLLNNLHKEILAGKVCTMVPGVKLTSTGIINFRK